MRATRFRLVLPILVGVLGSAGSALAICGDAIIDVGESCDEGASNGTSTSCCTAGCLIRPASEECRASADECDVAENCDGLAPTCPADVLQTAGATCSDEGNPCTVDTCDGVSAGCTHPAGNGGAVCRAIAGGCDLAEACDGVSTSCPGDVFEPVNTVCRAALDICDVTEACTGTSAACPADLLQPSTIECRASADVCDLAESCDGVNVSCPADIFQFPSTVCRASTGVCDVAENCDGTGISCPADVFQPATTVCRVSAGLCDVAESCTGAGAACPADAVEPSTTVCRPSAALCDATESCNGVNVTCPPDAPQANGYVCRPPVDACDFPETCSGTSPICPTDVARALGTVCPDDGNPCTTDKCNGVSFACQHPPGNFSALCRAAAGPCDIIETCDGVSAACPPNAIKPLDSLCRPSAGFCDLADTCNGLSVQCSPDAKRPATSECRAATNPCDITEFCNGVSDLCPGDTFAQSGTVCNDGSVCTQTDTCQAGVCVGSNPVTCTAQIECREAGVCDPGTGSCTYPLSPDGSPCNGGSACATGQQCAAGSCITGPIVPCTACLGCETALGCVARPQTGCKSPTVARGSNLLIRKGLLESRDSLSWIWNRGESTLLTDFGDPTSTTDYSVCIYDEAGGSSHLVLRADAPAGGICDTRDCWEPTSLGYRYRDTEGTPDGLSSVQLRSGSDGRSRTRARGKGDRLDAPTLPLVGKVTAQLQAENGMCWDAEFSSPIRNQPQLFRARSD